MFDSLFINRKLDMIREDLERLKEFEGQTIAVIAKDPVSYAACERYLERIIGRAIDVNQHLIAEAGKPEMHVRNYRDTFLRLADLGVYRSEFAESIAPSAGLRNALVHEYDTIDPAMLEKSITEAIKEFVEYAEYVLTFIENKNGKS